MQKRGFRPRYRTVFILRPVNIAIINKKRADRRAGRLHRDRFVRVELRPPSIRKSGPAARYLAIAISSRLRRREGPRSIYFAIRTPSAGGTSRWDAFTPRRRLVHGPNYRVAHNRRKLRNSSRERTCTSRRLRQPGPD